MIDLSPYEKRRVVIHLKQPYHYQLVRSEGGKPVPLAITKDKDGRAVIAKTHDIEDVAPLTVTVLVGVVIERGGHYVLEMEDQTNRQGDKIEIAMASEVIHFVSVVRESSILIG